MVGIHDTEWWAAQVDSNPPPPGFEYAIIIRGRSRPSAYDKLDAYHRKNECKHTKAAHADTMDQISKNPARMAVYYCFLFKEKLDNVILSGDDTFISKQTKGISYMAGEEKGIEVKDMFVSWRIAKKGVGHKIEQDAKVSAKSAFD